MTCALVSGGGLYNSYLVVGSPTTDGWHWYTLASKFKSLIVGIKYMARCCGNRGRAQGVYPHPVSTPQVQPLPQGGPIMGQGRVCSKCSTQGLHSPMRVLHQYSSGGKNIQAYECMVCRHQDDVTID
jgi:hypothetical protein